MSEIKKTPLAELHEKLGGKMVEFAGWWMPIQYAGLKEEHLCVRNHVGLFDVSHMGEIRVKGPKALQTVEWLTTNDVARLKTGEAHYTLFPNEQGGLVDDLIVYCLKPESDYLLCVNAANKDKDLAWCLKHNKGADITDESSHWAQIAIQGPQALTLCERVLGSEAIGLKYFTFKAMKFAGFNCLVAATGYTGESGLEVFIESTGASKLWQSLLEKGSDLGVQPIGLGARDTLRTEMKYSLYGHEINDTTNPYEAGLGWVMKPQKKDFIGKDLILKQKEAGLKRQLIGFKMKDKGIARQGYALFSFDNKESGAVTSGTLSPCLNEAIGIGYVRKEDSAIGTQILVDIRGRKALAEVVKTPFVTTKV